MQQKSSTTMQHQDLVQTPQPAAAPANVVSVAPTQQLPKFHWSHALLAAGVLASSGVGTALLLKVLLVLFHTLQTLMIVQNVNLFVLNFLHS